jgi:hypothetical protein
MGLFLLIPVAAMVFCIIAVKFPYIGESILVFVGVSFAAWWLLPGLKNGFYTLSVAVERLFLSFGFSIVGVCFILDGCINPKLSENDQSWLAKNLKVILSLGIPILVGLGVAAFNLPIVLTRVDDGVRTARLIEGENLQLSWAPSGPGWNWKQDFGGYPSWDFLAAYGMEPIGLGNNKLSDSHASQDDMAKTGLCAFLSEDGKTLRSKPVYIWRMPTVDEIAGSLSQHNQNAACIWRGKKGKLDCALNPDKETPLWAPDQPPVYYWAGNAYDHEQAYYVSYTGWVNSQPKDWGNPRHGFRCVKVPSGNSR